MEETFFYCQKCDAKITVDQLALLNEGKCPECHSIQGFSTVSKKESDGFESLTIVNDTEMLEKVFEGKE
jgi:Zn finger protein HypA/HybF involved in hydrogenase expression